MNKDRGTNVLVPNRQMNSLIVVWFRMIFGYIFLKAKYRTKINPKGITLANEYGFVVSSLAKQF